MPDPIPAEAVEAAAEALAAYYAGPGGEPGLTSASFHDEVRAALEAAAPFIAAQALIRERRRALRLVRHTLVPRGCAPTKDAADLLDAIKGDLRV